MAAHATSEEDFMAEGDLEAITRAQEVEKDPARLAQVVSFAERRKEEFARATEMLPKKPASRFNGAVSGIKMGG